MVLLRPTVLELPSQLCRHPVTVTVCPLSEPDCPARVEGCELCCAASVRLLRAAMPHAATMFFVMTLCLLMLGIRRLPVSAGIGAYLDPQPEFALAGDRHAVLQPRAAWARTGNDEPCTAA